MVAQVKERLKALRYGFLFLPGIVVLGLAGLAFLLTALDRHGAPGGFSGDGSAARTVLTTIAGSLITVAGLTFSITLVTLQLVSQQFSPRAIRGFLADRLTQLVAGSFVGIFAYCLLVLRTVRDKSLESTGFVPSLSVTVAISLGLATVALLLIFIHHMAGAIQVSTIAAGISQTSLDSLRRLYPDGYGEPARGGGSSRPGGEPMRVGPSRPGYLQSIRFDPDKLARSGVTRLELPVAPGDFVTESTAIALVWGSCDQTPSLRIRVANERDIEQDIGYGIRQLSDIALKAISPGVNDPTTAVTCIGYLCAIMERLACAAFPAEERVFQGQELVVVTRVRPFEEYVEPAFVEIGRNATDDSRVTGALLDAIDRVAERARAVGAAERVRVLDEAAAELSRARTSARARSR